MARQILSKLAKVGIPLIFALAIILVLVPEARANGYRYGYTPSYSYGYSSYYPSYSYSYPTYSYAYQQPYYYPQAYSYYPPGSYSPGYYNGQYSNGGYYATGTIVYGAAYTPAQSYAAPQNYNVAPSYDKNWQTALIEAQKARDGYSAYLQATKALGFSAPLQSPYGAPNVPYPVPGNYATPYVGPYGVNGQSTYGVTLNQTTQRYGDTLSAAEMMTLFQAQARSNDRAQDLARDTNSGFSQNIALAVDGSARVAEYMAKAAAAMQVLRAVEPQASSTTKTTISAVQSGGTSTQAPIPAPTGPPNGAQGQPLPQQAPNGQGDVQIEQILKIFREGVVGKCSKCHGQSDPKGGFMIASYPNLDKVKQTKVIARLFHDNPEKHMPPASEPQLTTEETLTLIALRKPQ